MAFLKNSPRPHPRLPLDTHLPQVISWLGLGLKKIEHSDPVGSSRIQSDKFSRTRRSAGLRPGKFATSIPVLNSSFFIFNCHGPPHPLVNRQSHIVNMNGLIWFNFFVFIGLFADFISVRSAGGSPASSPAHRSLNTWLKVGYMFFLNFMVGLGRINPENL